MKTLLVAAMSVLVTACSRSSSDAHSLAAPPRHVIMITLDTLRADKTTPYGCAHDTTPNLTRFAAQSVQYAHAYTAMPTTGPAHISMFTGLYPEEHGSLRNGMPARAGIQSLPSILKQRGRATAAFVSALHLSKEGLGIEGFDTWSTPKGVRDGARTVDLAMQWLEKQGDQPTFLWVHLFDPHAPYEAHEGLSEELESLLVPLQGVSTRGSYHAGEAVMSPDEARKRELLYEADIYYTDQQVGRLLDFLDARDSAKQDLVIITADHGELMTELLATQKYAFDHGEYLMPGEIQVPLWIRWGGVKGGEVEPRIVETRALYGSILRATHSYGEPTWPCLPQFAMLTGSRPNADDSFGETHTERRGKAFITRRSETNPKPDDEKRFAVVEGQTLTIWDGTEADAPELYELATDRLGLVNVDREHAAIAREHRDWIQAWREGLTPWGDSASPESISPEMKKHLDALGY